MPGALASACGHSEFPVALRCQSSEAVAGRGVAGRELARTVVVLRQLCKASPLVAVEKVSRSRGFGGC